MAMTEQQKAAIERARSSEPAQQMTEQQQSAITAARSRMPQQLRDQEIVATTPNNGVVYRTKDGSLGFVSPSYATSDQEQIKSILQDIEKGADVRRGVEQRQLVEGFGKPAAFSLQALQSLPFVGSYTEEMLSGGDPEKMGLMRDVQTAFEEQYPKTALGATAAGIGTGVVGTMAALPGILGAAGAAVPAVGRIGQAITQLPTLGKAAVGTAAGGLFGALEGGVYGYGAGETPEERIEKAQKGALFGGGVGAGVGAAIPAGGAFINWIKRSKGSAVNEISATLGISPQAAKIIEDTFKRGLDVEDAVQNIRKAGNEGMVVDADEATAMLLDYIATASVPGARAARGPVEARAQRSSAELSTKMDDVLGPAAQGRQTALEEIALKDAPARQAAYNKAFDQPINYASDAGRKIEDVFNRTPNSIKRSAIRDANESMVVEGRQNMQILADIADDGTVVFREMPNVEQAHYLKMALDKIGMEVDSIGKVTPRAQRARGLANDLRTAMQDAVPEYKIASKLGGEKIRDELAFVLGMDLMSQRTTRDQVIRQMKNATRTERESAKIGLRTQIDEAMANTNRAATSGTSEEIAEALKTLNLMSSRAFREKAEVVIGNKEASDKLFRELDKARASLQLRGSIAANSKTAQRQAIEGSFEEALTPGFLGSLARLKPAQASQELTGILSGATRRYTQDQKDALLVEVAQALTGKRGREAELAVQYITEAMQNKKISQAKSAFVSRILFGPEIQTGAGLLYSRDKAEESMRGR